MPRGSHHWRILAGASLSVSTGTAALAQEPGTKFAVPPIELPPATGLFQIEGGTASASPTVLPAPIAPPTAAVPLLPCAAPSVSWWRRFHDRLHRCFLGLPEEFEPTPLGASFFAFGQAQVANGEAAQMVLYHADFIEHTANLSLHGRERLTKIAGLLARTFAPLVIERTLGAPELDQARALAVMNDLNCIGFTIPPQRVVIGPALAYGMDGNQALIVYGNLLNQTQLGGAKGGGAASVGGGYGPSTSTGSPVK